MDKRADEAQRKSSEPKVRAKEIIQNAAQRERTWRAESKKLEVCWTLSC